MELSQLVFKVDTTELERAGKMVTALVDDFKKFDKAAVASAKVQAQTDEILSRMAKNQAKAAVDVAKARDIELRSVIAADKADEARAKSIEKSTKATEKAAKVTKDNVSILERQTDIQNYMVDGFSKGQSSLLAYAKAAGVAGDEMRELQKVLQTQRSLQGGDPFDKSISGLISLKNQYRELQVAIREYNTSSGLTSKQTRELARDEERLTIAMKQQGKSVQEVNAAIQAHAAEYTRLASQVNNLTAQEDKVIKQRKEMVQATNYMTTAEEKLSAALSETNAGIQKSGTDLLVKYESALRKSGATQDVVTSKLATYKAQLKQVQALEEKRQAQNLTRAISPQLTDIGVSLYSGQSPLTVLLQQGGQLADQFRLSGVEAGKLGKLMKESFYSMIPVIKEVGSALGGLVVGVFTDLGKGTVDVIGKVTGITWAFDKLKGVIAAGGEENFKYIGSLNKLGAVLSSIAAGGIAALTVAIIGLGVGFKQTITEQDAMAKALVLNAGGLKLTQEAAYGYVQELGEMGVTTGKATEAIIEMAKAGNFTASEIMTVSKAAVDMSKYLDVSIEDTVKSFSKLKQKPVESILELAKATGLVAPEVVKAVIELERQGKTADAVAIAIKALADVNSQQVARMKEDYNGFSLFMIELGGKIKSFFSDAFKSLFYNKPMQEALNNQLAEVQAKIQDVKKNLETNSFFGISGDNKLLDTLKEQERMILKQIDLGQVKQQQETQRLETNTQSAKAEEYFNNLREKGLSSELKARNEIKELEGQREEFRKKGLLTAERELLISQAIAKQQKTINDAAKAGADKQAPRDMEAYKDILNKAAGYTKSYNNEVASLDRMLAAGILTQDEYNKTLEQLNEMQPKFIADAKEKQAILDLENKLTGKANDLGAEYYKTLMKINEVVASGKKSPEWAAEMKKLLDQTTPAAKALEALNAKQAANAEKLMDSYKIQNMELAKSDEMLNQQYSLLGLSNEQARLMTIEQSKQNKLAAARIVLEKQLDKIRRDELKGDISGSTANDARLEAEQGYAEQVRQINKETALQYAQDVDKDFRKIKETITDSIVTAMFDGGKAGAQKLRDGIKSILREKFTIFIDAQVSGAMNSIFGSSTSSSGSTGGGLLSSALGLASGGSSAGTLGSLLSSSGMGTMDIAGFSLGGLTSGISAIATAVPYIGIGVAAISALSKAFKGGGPKVEGMYSSQSGVFGHSNRTSAYNPLAEATYDSISAGYSSLVAQLGGTAGTVGGGVHIATDPKGTAQTQLDTIATLNGVQTYSRRNEYGGIENVGRTEEELQAAINDSAAKAVLTLVQATSSIDPRIAEFVKGIEYKGKTIDEINAQLARATAFLEFSNILKNTPFENVKNLSMTASESLISLAGGLSSLTSGINSFYTSFYSEAEQTAQTQANLVSTFKGLNIAVPDTLTAFRNLVNSQDLTTESGRKTYATLLGISETFANLNKSLKQTAFDNLTNAIEKENNAANALLTTINGVFDILQSNLQELYGSLGTSVQNAAQANVWLSNALETARTSGVLPDSADLTSAIGAARGGLSSSNFATALDQKRETARLTAKLQALADITGGQKTAQELIIESNNKLLESAQLQLDASNGIIASNLTVAEALMQFQATLVQAITGEAVVPVVSVPTETTGAITAPATTTPQDNVVDNYTKYLQSQIGVSFDDGGSYQDWLNANFPSSDLSKNASGNTYDGGVALVGEKGPELINFGTAGYVYNAGRTVSMLADSSSEGRINSLEKTQSAMLSVLSKIEGNTDKTKKILERVSSDSGGDAISVVTAPQR